MNRDAIRFARVEDADAILDIYTPYVLETAFTYEYDVPTREEFSSRVAELITAYPYLVHEENGVVLAYAYAHSFAERAANMYNMETSIYVMRGRHGGGIGGNLYNALLAVLAAQNYYNAFALIATPNPASEKMHQALGFSRIGQYEKTGYKFGQWHGMAWYHKPLRDHALPPEPIRDYRDAGAEFGLH